MSKIAKFAKKSSKKIIDVIHPPFLRTQIPAQMAKPVPPLGNQLGVRNVNVANFCKEFNSRTSHIKEGVPIPCHIFVNPDRTYRLEMIHPTHYYLLLMASGAKKGSYDTREDSPGLLSIKHIYEIAKLKHEEINQRTKPLEEVCEDLLRWCRVMAIKVQYEVTTDEMKEFLEKRSAYLAQLAVLKENKIGKKK